jgi:hypothetical protein
MTTPRIFHSADNITTLPPGNRAHEMPDQVQLWIIELQNAEENLVHIFPELMVNANHNLSNEDFNNLCISLKNGIKKANESFQKWLKCWTHLPLSICRLGSNNGSVFARAFLLVFFNCHISAIPDSLEITYVDSLKLDLQNNNRHTFGLLEALSDNLFFQEFKNFASANTAEHWKYPYLYSFIKNHIWNIIVHQQQLEGMFNKYDMKTDPNMNFELQQSRIQLSGPKGNDLILTQENLKEVRKLLRNKMVMENDNIVLDHGISGEKKAAAILDKYL